MAACSNLLPQALIAYGLTGELVPFRVPWTSLRRLRTIRAPIGVPALHDYNACMSVLSICRASTLDIAN